MATEPLVRSPRFSPVDVARLEGPEAQATSGPWTVEIDGGIDGTASLDALDYRQDVGEVTSKRFPEWQQRLEAALGGAE